MNRKPFRYMIALLLASVLLAGLAVTAAATEGGEDPAPGQEPTGETTPDPSGEPTADPTPDPTPIPAAEPPRITADLPGTLGVPTGGTITLTVRASGEGLAYQWFKDGQILPEYTGDTVQVSNAQPANAGLYYCFVHNAAGGAESTGCTVMIVTPPQLTRDISPTSLTLNEGDTISLTAAADGENMAVHWFYKKGDAEIHEFPGQNGAALTVTAGPEHNGADFFAQFINEAGAVVTSFCHVTVNKASAEPPRITKDPQGEVVPERGSAIFIAHAEGAASCTWRFLSGGGASYDYDKVGTMFPGLVITGGDTDTITLSGIPAELNGWRVACLFRSAGGETLSGAASIQVQRTGSAVSITAQPKGATLAVDEDPDFTLSVSAMATDGGILAYQWYSASTNSAAAMRSIPGATDSSYRPAQTEGTVYYRVGITATGGGVTSEPVYSSTVPVSFTTKKEHQHTYSTVWEHNDLSHWHQCVCGDHADEAMHTYQWTVITEPTQTADGQQKGECTVCGYETVQPIPAGSAPVTTAPPAAKSAEHSRGWLLWLVGALALAVVGTAAFLILRVLRAPEEDDDAFYEDDADETGPEEDSAEEDKETTRSFDWRR